MKKIFALVLALAMVLSMVACGAKTPATDAPAADAPVVDAPAADVAETETEEAVANPFADIEDYDELSSAVYEYVLGEFYEYYMAAQEATNTAERYALMAIAEAKMKLWLSPTSARAAL